MSLMFGTVSYLPVNDSELRQARWKSALHTFKHFSELCRWVDAPLHIVTTGWTQEDFRACSEVCDGTQVVFYTVPLEDRGANVSKNLLLETFYSSGYDYLFYGDDDTWIYPHYGIRELFETLNTHPEKFYERGIHMILSVRAEVSPYKEQNMLDVDFPGNWVFSYHEVLGLGYPMFFFNTRKHLGKDILAPRFADKAQDLLNREDLSFFIESLKLGSIPMTCSAFISSTVDTWKNSTYSTKSKTDESVNLELTNRWMDLLFKVYPGLRRTGVRSLDYSAYYPKGFSKDKVLIPRAIPYQFTENDMPKKRTKKVKLGLLK